MLGDDREEDLEDVSGLLDDCICVARGAQFGDLFDEFVAQRCPKVLGVQCPYVGNASCTSNDAWGCRPALVCPRSLSPS